MQTENSNRNLCQKKCKLKIGTETCAKTYCIMQTENRETCVKNKLYDAN